MSEIKYIFELTEEEVKLLAYGAMPKELKEKLMEVACHIDSRKNIEIMKNKQKDFKKVKVKNFMEIIREEYPKAYVKWTHEEDIELKKEFKDGKTIKELSELFQRKQGGIESRLVKLGLIEEYNNK